MRRRTLNMVQMVDTVDGNKAKSKDNYNVNHLNERHTNNSKVQGWISSHQEYLYMGPSPDEAQANQNQNTFEENCDENVLIHPNDNGNIFVDKIITYGVDNDGKSNDYQLQLLHAFCTEESNVSLIHDQTKNKSEENHVENVFIYPTDNNYDISEVSSSTLEEDNDDVDKDKDYQPQLMHESSSNESNISQVQDQTQNTCEENDDENDVPVRPYSRKLKLIRQANRQRGLLYTTENRKKIEARSSFKELVTCRMKCKDWLQEIKSNIFNEYWNLGSRAVE